MKTLSRLKRPAPCEKDVSNQVGKALTESEDQIPLYISQTSR